MKVYEFLKVYFGFESKFQNVIVQRNDGDGKLKVLYSGDYGGKYMRWEVKEAIIRAWGIDEKMKRIWITVNPEEKAE